MKKLFIILLTVFMLSGCDQIIETIETIEETTDIINYFVDIEPSKIEGTENTEFSFTANTNDTVDQWIINGAILPADYARTANDNDLIYSFSSGTHTIGVQTANGATDEIEIIVSPVEIIFKLSAVMRENTTEFYLDFPLLTIEGTEYNIETMGSNDFVTISETEEQRIISLNITVDNTDSFCFMNNNAMNIYEIDLHNMSAYNLTEMIIILFPERYEEPEPVIPDYSDTRFNLSGHNGAVSDYLIVYDDRLNDQLYIDNSVYMDDIRKVMLNMQIDDSDSFLFMNNNMQNFFNIDFADMSYDELIIAVDILNRYPEEGILELQEIY